MLVMIREGASCPQCYCNPFPDLRLRIHLASDLLRMSRHRWGYSFAVTRSAACGAASASDVLVELPWRLGCFSSTEDLARFQSSAYDLALWRLSCASSN